MGPGRGLMVPWEEEEDEEEEEEEEELVPVDVVVG